MLFQTKLHDMDLPSVRFATSVLHYQPSFAHHKEINYRFFPSHCHNFFELQFFYCTQDKSYNPISHFPQNTLLIFNPLQPHSCEHIGFEYLLLIQFTTSFLKYCISSLPGGSAISFNRILSINEGVQIKRDTTLFRILLEMASFAPLYVEGMDEMEFHAKSRSYHKPEYETKLNGALLLMLSELMSMKLTRVFDEKDVAYTGEISQLVEQIVTNPGRKISMQQAASMTHMSYSDFSRNFKSMMGIGYVDFFNSVRVNESQNYLLNSDYTTTEIADKLSFGSASYFSRIFNQFTGCTPNQFKNKYMKK